MTVTLTSCASRKMLSSVCLLPIPLVFHGSILNVLSDMVGVWAGLGGGEGACGCGGVIHAVQNPAIGFTIIRSVSKTRTSCTQVAGALASDVFEADRAGVP